MKLLKIQKNSDFLELIDSFKKSKVIAILSDTIYGLSCKLDDKKAIDKICKIKNRKIEKNLLLLLSELEMVKKYFFLNKKQELYLKDYYNKKNKRPCSFILQPKISLLRNFPDNYNKEENAFRLPKNNFLIKIIRHLGTPIISTSCNLSGEKNLNNFKTIISFFKNKDYRPDLIVKYDSRPQKKASRILDIRDINNIKIIRD